MAIHQRSVYSEKILKLAILGKGPRESGYLGMNCIDVRGRAFDKKIDDQKPEGLLRTSLQAVKKLDNNQNRKLSLGASMARKKSGSAKKRTSRERF